MRDSTIIYRSFFEAIKELPKENQAEVWNAIFEYSLNFNEIELNGISKTIFTLIKPQLSANITKYKNGKKEKKSKTEAKRKLNGSKTEGNVNDNVNDNVNANVNVNAIKTRFEKFKISLLTQQIFLEDICMKAEIKISEVPQALDNFIVHAIAGGENHLTQKEFATHFRNLCLKIKSAIIKHTHTPHYSQW